MSSSADSHAVSYLVGVQDELVYDFLISLDAEIQLVWKAPWKFGKLLYFLTRYLPFVGAIVTIHFCFSVNRSRSAALGTCKALSEATASEVILSLRVWALWENSWKVACLLAIGFLIPMPIMTVSVSLHDSQYHYNTLSAGDLYESITPNQFGLCPLLFDNSNDTIMLLVYLMIYETMILVLTIQGKKAWSIWGSHVFYIQILLAWIDIQYSYSGKLSCKYNNIIISTLLSGRYAILFLGPQVAIHSILTSQMLLHIRQEAMDAALPTTQFSQSLHFASGPLNGDEFESDNSQRIQSQVSQQLADEGQSWFGGLFERSQVSIE
ncbi:hypothetical protein K435DRAFT_806540 [Dendrothele bispora CBS 962.96]|uniref:DUF6533 domain-containing protein n=1 Tax=Dendrothele bispora (strain CBS 962.96) TaxID=1314807 RepID=A0A4S8L7H3_DENBC|nr:hypothetical protein K435DRAFT_806540 [Dendrothele bispora CBS 962.96]